MCKEPDNLRDLATTGSENCSVCRDLLSQLGRFAEMIESARRSYSGDWLTVEEVAQELKISRSIVYRLIRIGELPAINIVAIDGDKGIAKKGHYRIKKSDLAQYVESKRVKPLPRRSNRRGTQRQLPRVKNHLGL